MRASVISLLAVVGVVAVAIVGVTAAMPQQVEPRGILAPIPASTIVASAAPVGEPTVTIDPAWLSETSARTGIAQLALSAYAQAALAIGQDEPSCNLGWNTLAALGTVESAHGTVNGGALDENGDAVPVIVGPSLDGRAYTAVHDTDGGAIDGDNTWDRAVGPLQFLPATWALFDSDGNGDGVSDPNNIFDASLGAGRYLCATAGDVSDASRWSTAILAYNPNDSYLSRVRDLAISYAG